MHPNIERAYNVLNNTSLTHAYASRKAKAYLRNALWTMHETTSSEYFAATFALIRLSCPVITPEQRLISARTILGLYLELE